MKRSSNRMTHRDPRRLRFTRRNFPLGRDFAPRREAGSGSRPDILAPNNGWLSMRQVSSLRYREFRVAGLRFGTRTREQGAGPTA